MARKTAQRETQNGEHQKTKSERNFYGSGNNAGARYKTTEALQEAVDRYFEKALATDADGAAAEVVAAVALSDEGAHLDVLPCHFLRTYAARENAFEVGVGGSAAEAFYLFDFLLVEIVVKAVILRILDGKPDVLHAIFPVC